MDHHPPKNDATSQAPATMTSNDNGTTSNGTTNGNTKGTTSSNGNGATTVLASSHLLAQNFVPGRLRAINAVPVATIIPTHPPPTMEEDLYAVFSGLVVEWPSQEHPPRTKHTEGRPHPQAVIPTNNAAPNFYNTASQQQLLLQRIDLPILIKTCKEAGFVEQQIKRRLAKSKDAQAASRIPAIGRDLIPGGSQEVGTTQHYLAVFRELLQVESTEVEKLYEQSYNQYKIQILGPPPKNDDPGFARIKVMGISDGRPSIRPGDLVRIRPHSPLYTYNNNNNPLLDGGRYPHLENNNGEVYYPNGSYHHPTYHQRLQQQQKTVEIQAHVVSVTRGKSNKWGGKQKKDTVFVSWITNHLLDTQIKKDFCNVRFVPSKESHERCLTALHWLQMIDPAVARDILFPSRAPKLPPPPALVEDDETMDTTEEQEYEQLNQNQARFIQMVLTRTAYPTTKGVRPPMILTGPAGTGKTKTILAAILQILSHQHHHAEPPSIHFEAPPGPFKPRILICTPSHTACDVITQRLVALLERQQKQKQQKDHPPPGIQVPIDGAGEKIANKIFRLYDATRPIETVPVQILPYVRQKTSGGGQFCLPDAQELLGFSVIICTCQDAHLLFRAGLSNSSLRKRRQGLATDALERLKASGLELHGSIQGQTAPHFTHLFIDEAAQATEPESLIPLSVVVDDHPDATKVEIALCGDPRQLGPSIYSPTTMQGLQRSLLERLLRLPTQTYGGGKDHLMGPHTGDSRLTLDEMIEYSFQTVDYRQYLSVFLNKSYRGHPSFLYMPSKLFYFDKLRSHSDIQYAANDNNNDNDSSGSIWIQAVRNLELLPDVTNAHPESLSSKPMDWPMMFYGVDGNCTSVAVESFFGSNCWCNHSEAMAVVRIIQSIIRTGVSTASIGVMAAFRAQVVLIRKILRERNLGSVNVGMVEDYQSMERDVIVLSLTRSNLPLAKADALGGEGLFYQPKRMNVALTRAEQMLVVVGNPNAMKEDSLWAQWLDFCKQNGLWYTEEPREEKQEEHPAQ